MTKTELIKNIHYRTGHTEERTKVIVDEILELMSQTLVDRRRIEIREFFSFQVGMKRSRAARNPKTGEPLHTKAKPYVKGKQSKSWCHRENGIVSQWNRGK